MYNYKPGNECFGLKECKEGLYHSNEFLELEKFLMGIVDEEEHYNTDIIGSPSTVDSVTQYPQISKIENKQSLVINRKKTDKFMLSSVLKNNWADSAVRFKFEVFDRILNEKKVKSNAPIKSNYVI